MEDRRAVSGALGGGLAIEVVVENGADRAVTADANLERAQASRLDPLAAEGFLTSRMMPRQARKPCSGWRRSSRICSHKAPVERPMRGLAANALDGPLREMPMAPRHVLGDGCVAVIARVSQMGGDALALAERLHRARRDAHVELVFREAVGNAVIVIPGFDMIIETGAAHPPLGINIRLPRQRPELGPVELFEVLPAG